MTSKGQVETEAGRLRDKMIILAMVNMLQPVKYDTLADGVSDMLGRRRVSALVSSLRERGLLTRLDTGDYVVTREGRDAIVTPVLRKRRDVGRMRYLYQRSKGGGGET